ncbi:23S rRNA (pseudouridine(1915)-N(3))-methyltransferase RlmH [Acetivibrio clariflavus]|uniref:Ribosomal RNA large subunit methyltransferase H n=1 Tax=Acetivibrio clariflavus (strain DSM 19732 / NBRC 101661 / EBR45) TaxID=720554 RepID=G8LUF0_ACECE|nr:23S rRNA (pseudouridine(1915)-N(3))-methyltransferase RlmH [Acetivibrio clariflavus]AEV70598.1 rRNA large subunit m3Psi methyltransferase RlmH [Acetivibrio clariflavus DSM 19732]
MKITIVAVGKLKGKYLKEGISEYSKRLSRFCELQIIEVEDEQAPENLSVSQEEQVKRREAERIIKRVKEGSVLIVLDLKGKKLSSEEFSDKLNSFFISGKSHITFVIGGSLGLDEELVRKADFSLSLSDMTFPHQLARLILVEQIFRAFKILNNETYHK